VKEQYAIRAHDSKILSQVFVAVVMIGIGSKKIKMAGWDQTGSSTCM
jgi:hypothetical protein